VHIEVGRRLSRIGFEYKVSAGRVSIARPAAWDRAIFLLSGPPGSACPLCRWQQTPEHPAADLWNTTRCPLHTWLGSGKALRRQVRQFAMSHSLGLPLTRLNRALPPSPAGPSVSV
jgi:hypothetical protein